VSESEPNRRAAQEQRLVKQQIQIQIIIHTPTVIMMMGIGQFQFSSDNSTGDPPGLDFSALRA
jgi:hypothetical protein